MASCEIIICASRHHAIGGWRESRVDNGVPQLLRGDRRINPHIVTARRDEILHPAQCFRLNFQNVARTIIRIGNVTMEGGRIRRRPHAIYPP